MKKITDILTIGIVAIGGATVVTAGVLIGNILFNHSMYNEMDKNEKEYERKIELLQEEADDWKSKYINEVERTLCLSDDASYYMNKYNASIKKSVDNIVDVTFTDTSYGREYTFITSDGNMYSMMDLD